MKPKESQSERIVKWLKASPKRKLTSLGALVKFDCWRLPSRVHDIRKKHKNLKKEMIKTKSGKWIAQYFFA